MNSCTHTQGGRDFVAPPVDKNVVDGAFRDVNAQFVAKDARDFLEDWCSV